MRIGIVSDIHEAVEPLARALATFRAEAIDAVVTLGDACDTFTPVGRADETATLLRDAGAVGVWGNHDFGLCRDVPPRVRERAAPATLDYMARLQPQLVVAGCRFSHVEPWLDAERVEDLWYFDGPPDTAAKAARSFAAVPEGTLFVGHFHRWLVTTQAGQVAWAGDRPLALNPAERHLIVVAAVVSGWCAVFNTEASLLTPVWVGD